MRKEDLENLMVVVTANNKKYLVVDGWLIGEEDDIEIASLNENLAYENIITKVYDKIDYLSDINEVGMYADPLWGKSWERKWIPNIGEQFYIADPTQSDFWNTGYWGDTDNGNYRLRLGLVYQTKAEAIEHGKRIVEMIKAEKNKDK